ncbi:hypothetical protein K488DRAFT_86145 [Vararia minispora EC-137]|uniref:Uncharacterized protein n=1 Tax=Vararia minispora EC-137 TaxID=1314806 RepID=A0ACB8QKG5_9AGAM|nr:hypothetical protein K488DRAFT_86145 [Vararia minispora EC-137]
MSQTRASPGTPIGTTLEEDYYGEDSAWDSDDSIDLRRQKDSKPLMSTLDLRSPRHFPDWRMLPDEGVLDQRYVSLKSDFRRHWALLGEIIRDVSVFRPAYYIRDRSGSNVHVVFYLSGGEATNFPHEKFVIIPCSLKTLLDAVPPAVRESKCALCKKHLCPIKKCKKCMTRYCDVECQAKDWDMHRSRCCALYQVRKWNRLNWAYYRGPWDVPGL